MRAQTRRRGPSTSTITINRTPLLYWSTPFAIGKERARWIRFPMAISDSKYKNAYSSRTHLRFDPPNRQLLSKVNGVYTDSNTCRGRHLTREREMGWSKTPTVRCSRCIKSRQLLTVLSPISSSPESTSCPSHPYAIKVQSNVPRARPTTDFVLASDPAEYIKPISSSTRVHAVQVTECLRLCRNEITPEKKFYLK